MKYLTLTIIICMCSCVRLPSDFEYNLRIIADTNEQMLMHIKEMDDKEIMKYHNMPLFWGTWFMMIRYLLGLMKTP